MSLTEENFQSDLLLILAEVTLSQTSKIGVSFNNISNSPVTDWRIELDALCGPIKSGRRKSPIILYDRGGKISLERPPVGTADKYAFYERLLVIQDKKGIATEIQTTAPAPARARVKPSLCGIKKRDSF
jgi:hypothetical protein